MSAPVLIFVAVLAYVVVQRYWYIAKMHQMGAAVIGEAYRVRDGWPNAYPAYRSEAAASLVSHGCSDLVEHLPEEKP